MTEICVRNVVFIQDIYWTNARHECKAFIIYKRLNVYKLHSSYVIVSFI